MRNPKLLVIITALFNLLVVGYLHAQEITTCERDLQGPNLVKNPSFELGDTLFTSDIGTSWNKASSCLGSGVPGDDRGVGKVDNSHHGDWSSYGQYYIGNRPSEVINICGFNQQFQKDWHTLPHSGNKYMIVDGAGGANDPIVWKQIVTVEANTWYYFETYIITLGIPNNKNVAHLKFRINGILQGKDIKPDSINEVWTPFRSSWFSGTVSGPITIEIMDTQGNNIGNDLDDFGLDDIAFVKGCPVDEYPEQPDLGADLSFCGTNVTSFNLDPKVIPNTSAGQKLLWSTGETTTTINVSTPGTYYVCFQNPGNCAKIDSIVVSDRFKIDLGSNVELCDPAALTLDAGFTGPGVTYQWYKDDVSLPLGKTKTLFVNEGGEYKVVVNDPKCQTEKDSINVTLKAGTPTPNNVRFCLTNNADTTITFSVNPAGTSYEWYDMPTGGTLIGSDTSSITRSGITTGDTVYVQDMAIQHSIAGSTYYNPLESMTNGYDKSLAFSFTSNFSIDSLQIPFKSNYSPAEGFPEFTVTIEVTDVNGNSFSPAKTFTSLPSLERVPGDDGNKTHLYTFPFTDFDISSTWGTDLRLKLKSATHGNGTAMFHRSGYSFPINSIPSGIVTITNSYSGDSWTNNGLDPTGYAYFFNWSISTASPCSRIPVMARDICVLPVTFATIKAIKADKGVKIFWATASEKDNSHFEIERLINGDWLSVGQIPANGNSNDYIQYDFTDIGAPNQVVYYRIKQVDFDGKNSYSIVVSVDNISFYTILRPNPSNSAAFLTIHSGEQSNSKITIHDALGRLVEELTVTNNQEHKIGEHYNTGVYIISIWAGPEPEKIKFIRK
jgi:hypothetical protein